MNLKKLSLLILSISMLASCSQDNDKKSKSIDTSKLAGNWVLQQESLGLAQDQLNEVNPEDKLEALVIEKNTNAHTIIKYSNNLKLSETLQNQKASSELLKLKMINENEAQIYYVAEKNLTYSTSEIISVDENGDLGFYETDKSNQRTLVRKYKKATDSEYSELNTNIDKIRAPLYAQAEQFKKVLFGKKMNLISKVEVVSAKDSSGILQETEVNVDISQLPDFSEDSEGYKTANLKRFAFSADGKITLNEIISEVDFTFTNVKSASTDTYVSAQYATVYEKDTKHLLSGFVSLGKIEYKNDQIIFSANSYGTSIYKIE